MRNVRLVLLSLALLIPANGALADEQAAIDGCIDQLRAVGGPDGQSGEVLSREWSQAGTLVMIRDAGGTVWRCIGYDDGAVGELSVVAAADDGGGAMAGATAASGAPETRTERVKFAKGTAGATLSGSLTPGGSVRYVLGAKANQFLSVGVAGPVDYQIFNPDQTFLLDMIPGSTPYNGQLWQSGDHVIEVINRGNGTQSYTVTVAIK
jgi:hypothetical protein